MSRAARKPKMILKPIEDVWTWKGRERIRKGRSEASPESSPRQHPGDYEAGDPSSCEERRCETYQRFDL
ncbi:hypothetical protein L1987_82396 [Smallanthus sonchifolius]|uniref:Uncharacterized protein n=1 Tax=Smallanthus sonchifolius TaxID=185202 RepID=A0ACB8YAC6_9ASTR|nr:hypothetical protein L1987_82396 [Smallanthus sonchifolius]